jgi:hypothetical protein
MNKLEWAIFGVVIVLGSSMLLFWQHYEIQPLPSLQQPAKLIYEARNRRCDMGGGIPVILKPVDETGKQLSVVALPSQEMRSGDLEKWLQSIFAARAERTIYVFDPRAVKEPHESSLVNLLMHYDFINQICVIDPQNPPKWYPPPVPVHTKNGIS